MKKIKLLLATSILISSAANALGPRTLIPVDGNYNSYSKAQYEADKTYIWANAVYAGVEYYPTHASFLCARKQLSASKRTPGKLVNGYCYYPASGDEKKNSEYFMLQQDYNGQYKWVSAGTLAAYPGTVKAVTTRAYDGGDLSYHCRYYDNTDGSVYPGKYLPGRGACYYANNGDEVKIKDASKFDILVPAYYWLF